MFNFEEAFNMVYKLVERRYLGYNSLTDLVMCAFMDNWLDEVEFSLYTDRIKSLIKSIHNEI